MSPKKTAEREEMRGFLRELLFTYYYRRKLFWWTAALTFLAFALPALLLPTQHRSTATFHVGAPQTLNPLQMESSVDYRNRFIRFLLAQRELILSNRVVGAVIAEYSPKLSGEALTKAVDDLKKKVQVVPPKGESFEASSLFFLSVRDNNPERAKKLADLFAKHYVQASFDINRERSDYSFEFFTGQVRELGERVKLTETQLREYETAYALFLVNILNLEPGKTNIEVGPKQLLTEAQRNRDGLAAEYLSLTTTTAGLKQDLDSGRIPTLLPEMEGPGKAVTAYKNKLAQLELQISEMQTQFTGQYPPLGAAQKELEKTTALLREEVARQIRSRVIQAQAIKSRLDRQDEVVQALEAQIKDITAQKAVYDKLKQEHKLALDSYTEARSKLEQARLAASVNNERANIVMIDAPNLPVSPVGPNRTLLLLLGIFAAAPAAASALLAADYFDRTIKTPEELKRYAKAPIFGSLPHVEPTVAAAPRV